MKKLICLLLFFALAKAYSQDLNAWIYFTDKPNVTTSLAAPQSILTQRAIQRKARHNIAIDSRDVPVNQSYVAQIKSATGITYKTQSKWFNCVHVTGAKTDIDALLNLSFVSQVDYADPTLRSEQVRADKFAHTTTPPLTYGNASNQITMIGLNQLHNTGNTGSGVHIAVTDSGFPSVNTNSGFAQLRANNGIADGYDFVAGDNSFYGDHFHGTRVLSIMAGNVPNSFEGSAPDASYYLYRTEDATSETPVELSYWVAAAERADSLGVDVINVSLGYLTFDNAVENMNYSDMDGQTSFISRGANTAFEKGMIVVASAGNSGNSSLHPYIAAPADAPGVFSIGAVNGLQSRVSFSSTGPTADNRLKPDVAAMGSGTALINENQSLTNGSGTSYSAPLISGGIACLIQAFPNLTPQQILDAVRASANQHLNPDNLLGHGIPDFGNAFTTLGIQAAVQSSYSYYVNEGYLYVTINEFSGKGVLALYNLSGQNVYTQELQQNNIIELSDLSTGMYLVQIDGAVQETFKIIAP